MSHRTIEVRHEGGLVYLDGLGMTVAEAESLVRLLQAAASEAMGWAAVRRAAAEMADRLARLEASGLTHITYAGPSGYLARRDGLPVIVSGGGERFRELARGQSMMSCASTTTSARASARMRFPSSRVIVAPPSLSFRSASAMPSASLAAAGAMVSRSSGVSMGLQYRGGM